LSSDAGDRGEGAVESARFRDPTPWSNGIVPTASTVFPDRSSELEETLFGTFTC